MLNQGVLIFIYLGILTGLEFFIAISFNAVILLLVVALVKAALVVYYYMHVYKLNLESEIDDQAYDYKAGTNPPRTRLMRSRTAAGTETQYAKAFRRGNAISCAPTRKGTA